MKQFFLLLAVAAFSHLHAQPILKNKTNPSIQPLLNEVVQDYFQNFENIKGDTLSRTGSTITFVSKIKLPGSLHCTINKYGTPNSYSWESLMFESEDFEAAATAYKNYYKQLNKSKFAPNGYEKFVLSGAYDAPDESRGFSSSRLKLEEQKSRFNKFTIDIGMQYLFPNWQVKVMVYEKVPDDEVRPGDF